MKNNEFDNEDYILEFLLKGFFTKNSFPYSMVDFSIIMPAVNSFMAFFQNEDSVNNTNHSDIILKIFANNEITVKNCSDIGLSISTFYRYKHRYLKMFKHFLSITIGELWIE